MVRSEKVEALKESSSPIPQKTSKELVEDSLKNFAEVEAMKKRIRELEAELSEVSEENERNKKKLRTIGNALGK